MNVAHRLWIQLSFEEGCVERLKALALCLLIVDQHLFSEVADRSLNLVFVRVRKSNKTGLV